MRKADHIRRAASIAFLVLCLTPATRAGGASAPEVQRIERIEFTGNESISSGALRRTMRLKQPVWWNPFRNTNYLGADYLAVDLYRVLDLYRDHGFPLASVRDASVEIPEDDGKVILRIDVAEGPRYHLGAVEIEGVRELSREAVRLKLDLPRGETLSRSRVDAARGSIETLYGESGFLSALIRSDLVLHSDTADVIFRVREGPMYRFRSVVVDTAAGTLEKTDPVVVRREVLMKPGDTMRSSRVLKTQERIFETGIFRSVRVLPSIDSTQTGEADLRITVRERKSGWYGFGAGYSSDDRAHLVAEWGNRNLGGRARVLEAYTDLALSLDPSFGRHRLPVQTALARLRYTVPWIFGARARNQVALSHTYEQQETFDQDITLLEEGLRRDVGRFSSVGLGITNKWVRTGDTSSDTTGVAGRSKYVTRNISSYVEEDRRDNLLDAHRGSYTQLLGEYAGGFLGGSNEFSRWNATGSWYHPFDGGMVAAFRTRVGVIIPVGSGVSGGGASRVFRIPFEERFRLGGGTSVRGYMENSLGLATSAGQPIGGTAIFLGNIELRFPVVWLFSGAIFLDGGNVWADPGEVKPGRFIDGLRSGKPSPLDVNYGAGAGLRILTPVGPFRADYGFKLGRNRTASDKAGELYLSLGQAF